SILFVQTNRTCLYAQVGRDGRASATELTLRDMEDLRRVVARQTSEEMTGIFMDSFGRVTAETLTRRERACEEGQVFSFKRTAKGWVVRGRGSWSVTTALPSRQVSTHAPAPVIH